MSALLKLTSASARTDAMWRVEREMISVCDDINELEDELDELNRKLEELEEKLAEMKKFADSDGQRRVKQQAREILAMTYVSGGMRDLAMHVVEDGADEEETESIIEYHEMRSREEVLS
ncbi:MAG: hypothetical protein NTX35_20785 [Verrucomicrobia bacterium]|nr:hypothetical protein [Verrucomicrobiota bacterium]